MVERIVLVTGSRGFIGSSFIEAVSGIRKYKFIYPPYQQMDITIYSSVEEVVKEFRPDTIINFAAHRNANTAEEQRNDIDGSAWLTNVIGARNLAKISDERGMHLIHISTDMVFSGDEKRRGPYSESATPENDLSKLSWYGWTKRLGEEEIRTRLLDASIVRIGNVTKPTLNPNLDYLSKVLWLCDNGMTIFDDQFITLSRIGHLIEVILELVERNLGGIFHVASDDIVTPFQLANSLVRETRPTETSVVGSSIDDYLKKFPNRYPKFGGLESQYTQSRLGIISTAWSEAVRDFVLKLYESKN